MTGLTETEQAETAAPGKTRHWPKWLAVALLLAAVYAGRHFLLRQIGSFLVQSDQPQQADIAVVLAGDGYGHRILKAAELARQGYIKHILVDGPRGMYGFDEAALAIHYAVDQGAPREIFSSLVMRARSTMAEAQAVDAELRRQNVRKALIVTSNYHTRRARSVFGRYASRDIQYLFVAAPDEDFTPGDWWHSRDAEKVVFLEYAKLFDWWLIEGRQ